MMADRTMLAPAQRLPGLVIQLWAMDFGTPAGPDGPQPSNEYDDLVADQVNVTGVVRQTVYRTAPPGRTGATGKLPEQLPDIGSAILTTPGAQTAFHGFGVDGLKTYILTELLKLGGRALDDELAALLGATEPVVKRALRATKLLALQWLEDSRQSQDVRLKCQALFERIPTFNTGRLAEPEPAPVADSGLPAVPPAPKRVGSVAGVALSPGDRLHVFTDLKGDAPRLQRLLREHSLVDAAGNWNPGPEDYLLIVGDLTNSSPYEAWGPVGDRPFEVITTLRRLAATGNIGFAAGGTDMAIAKRTFFRHPRYGFSAPNGQPRLAQGLLLARDLLIGTAAADPHHPYAAWVLSEGFFRLKPSHQLLGLPQLELWASGDKPDTYPLIEAIERAIEKLCNGTWTTQQQLNDELPTMLPMGTDDLAYADSREALVEGLLQGTGTIEFFRQSLAAQWRFKAGEEIRTVSHAGIGQPEIGQWQQCKEQGWELPSLAEFLAAGSVPKPAQSRLIQVLASLNIQDVPGLVAYDGEFIAQKALERRAVDSLCQLLGLKRDRTGFAVGWEQWRRRWMAQDGGGLAGGDLDGGQGKLEVVGNLDDKAVSAYADQIWAEMFGTLAAHKRLPDGKVIWETSRWRGVLNIDPSVKVVRDGYGRVQLPMKHDLTLQFLGDPT
jgi:hypothetical protein